MYISNIICLFNDIIYGLDTKNLLTVSGEEEQGMEDGNWTH